MPDRYDNLATRLSKVYSDIPKTGAELRKRLSSDKELAGKLYDVVSQKKELFPGLGSRDAFIKTYSGGYSVTPQRKQQASAAIGGTGNMTNWANPVDATDMRSEWEKQQKPREQKPNIATETQKAVRGEGEGAKRLRAATQQLKDRADYQKETGKELKSQVDLTSVGVTTTLARDEQGAVMKDASGNPLIGYEADSTKANVQRQEDEKKRLKEQLEEAYAEREKLDAEIEEGRASAANRLLGGMLPGNQVKSGYNDADMEQSSLLSAKRLLDRRITALEAANNSSGFWGGTKDQLKDPTSWSFGLSDAEDALVMANLKKKLDAAGGDTSKLTEGERLLADNYLKNQEAQKLNEDRDWWYGAGQGFGQSLSFMKDFALSGGGFANIAKAGMRYGAKKGAQLASKTLGNYMTKNLGTKALGKTIETIGKGAGLVAGTEAGGLLLNNTVQAASSAADIINKNTGNLTYDKDGNLTFEGGQSLGKAILTSQLSRTGENASELFGLAFDAVPGILGKVIQRTTPGKVLKNIANNKVWKAGEKGLDYLGVQSVWGEGMEEEYGMLRTEILNTLTNGKYEPNGSGILDMKKQLDTWATVGLTSMLLRVPTMIASGTNTANYYANKYNLNSSDKNMRNTFGNDERYNVVKTAIDEADNNQLAGVLNNLMTKSDLTDDEKQAMFTYANDLVKMRGYNIGNVVAAANGYTEPPRVSNYNIRGLHVDEVDKDGNVINSYDYDNADDLKTGLYEMQQNRADQTLQSDLMVMKARPNDQYQAFVDSYCEQFGVEPQELEEMLAKPSMERTEAEQSIVAPFADSLHNVVYDNSVLHEEQSQQDGEDLADVLSLDLSNLNEEQALEAQKLTDEYKEAENALQELYKSGENGENIKEEIENMAGQPAQSIVSSLETFSPKSVDTVIGYYNAKAKLDGFINRMKRKISEEAENRRERHTFTGTINGQEDKTNIVNISDGTNTYTLVSGNVTTDGDGRITGSDTGLIIALDENGDFVQLSDTSGYGIVPSDMTLDQYQAQQEEELQLQMTNTMDPEGKLMEEQAEATAGGEDTGANGTEASPSGTALERIPKDEQGNPIYEQGTPEDTYDALTEQVGESAQILIKNQLDAAKKRYEKLVKDKEAGKLKGKTLQEQIAEIKELQDKIDAEDALVKFWTKVMTVPNNRRADEEANVQPAVEETPQTGETVNETNEESAPDWSVDKASDARARGYRMENGYRVGRQQPITEKVEGNDTEVKFDKAEEPVKGKLVVVESGSLIPSHVNGQRNVNFFINEAQPKERTDIDSDASSTRIAKKINPEEITAGVTAFTGSPVVNTRGEVIQGNNRTIGLQKMWNNYPDSQDKYKQYLIDHAEEFGLNKDEIVKMSSPVLVRMVDVPDEEAIRLGQKTASNTESGGKERIDPMRVIQLMGDDIRIFTNELFGGEIEGQTLLGIISENGVKVLKWLNDAEHHQKYISDTQFQSCFDTKGNLTEEAKTDLRKIVENLLFQDAPESLPNMFYKMPAKAQSAILSTLWRDSKSDKNDKIIKDIQSSIEAFTVVNSASEQFRNAKNVNSARAAVKDMKNQTQVLGDTNTVLEKFSNFALELAAMYKGATQNTIRDYFNTYYDDVQGKGGNLFEPRVKKSKEQAIKDTYGIDINEKENGEEGNNTLESGDTNGESGEPGNEGEPAVGEPVEEGEQPAVSGGGTETSGEVEAATEEQPTEEAVEEQPKEEEPFELTLEALEASDLDESVKSGARAWLNGDKTQANQLAFLAAQDYVRSIFRDSERGGTDADTSQLGSEDNGSTIGQNERGNGEGGRVDSADNGEGVSEVGPGGENSTSDVASGNGVRSDNEVPGEASGPVGSTDTNGAVGSSGNRRTGRNGKPRGEGSGRTVPKGNAGRGKKASIREELDAALDEFEDALKESITEPLKGKLLAADPVSLYAFLGGAKAIKVLSAGAKVAYAAIRLGYYEFKDWIDFMKSKIGVPLRNIAGMSDEQIEGFVEMMWDYSLTIDGVTHKVSEWASIISDEKLREEMGKTIEQKRELQKKAEKTPTILEDITNIRESLPFLLPKQQEDVQKAEKQFFNESHADARHGHGKGYLFTNGTGTGKTYTGLGIVKRFLKQGKGRVLIVTVSDTKIKDWIKDAKNLGIEASMLPDTSSKGKGVVVTQYANIRQNNKLLEDEFDLIVYDECQEIMKNQDGSSTSTSRAHHMLANRDERQAARRIIMSGEFGKKVEEADNELELLKQAVNTPTTEWTDEVKKAYTKAGGNMDSVEDRIKELKDLVEGLEETLESKVDEYLSVPEQAAQAREAAKKTKVVFLSATPFNVPANLDYTEGYIFSYTNTDDVEKEAERLRRRDSFLVDNFNSSHKRNPKTQTVSRIPQERIPDPQKASEEEIAFSDNLQNDLETMSGRDLDSEYDYSREFPSMDFAMADAFNDAVQSLSDGRFDPLRKYFDHLLDDYATMTAYLEIFKAQMIAPRLHQYIDLGKKVTLYHRRKASNANMYPPFRLAMEKARQVGDEKIDAAADAFESAFHRLFEWELSIDYMFPQDSILREFMTEKEKATYKKEIEDWMNQYGEQLKKLQSEVMNLNVMIDLFESSGHKEKTPELLDKVKEKNKEIEKIMKRRPKPKCAVVSVYNGDVSQKERNEAIDKFNDDNSTTKVLVLQVQSGGTGISIHDTTGKYPRVQIGIFLPQSPIEFIQTEGRIFRVGNKSNAIFEYPLLGLDIELGNFAQKINGRSQTTENLALGSRSRGLRESISRAALASRKIDPSTATGIGGKELDSRKAQNADGFDEAMKNYSEWREEPKPTDINQIEVPDPIGYVMTKLTRAEKGERALVPNAKRGSVARYMPSSTRLTAMEERNKDYARLSALIGGSGRKILNEPFSEHNRVNKYDIVVINTSHGNNGEKDMFGNATSLDTKDVLKACNHTDPSGRVVALVESDKVGQIKEALKKSTTSVPVMEVKLPSFVLGNPSSIVILDNIENRDKRNAVKTQELDLSQAKTEDNLFAQLRDMTVPERNIDQEGRVERRLRTVVTPFVNTGCLAKSKNFSTNKMEPDIQCTFGRLLATFARNKMVWVRANGRAWRQFVIRYSRIVENDISYIQEIANDWININRQLELDDDSLYDVVKYWLDGKDRLGGVRDCLKIMSQAIEIALGKTPMQIRNIAEGKVENEVSGVYDLKGFREVFDSLNNNDAELEALADKVFEAVDHIEGLKFSVLPGAAFRNGGGHNVVAHYVPSRNIIELNSDLFNSVRIKDSFKAQTVVHEMIHALTSWAIETYDNEATRGQLSQEQQEACKTIKDVFAQINNDDFRRQLRLESNIEDNAEYGLTDEHEMMAELSNPIFRKVLKAKKLWKQLINGIKMLLGIQIPGTEAEETDALTALDDALETLMNTYDPNLYSSFIRNNEAVRNMEIMNPSDPMQAINDAAESWRGRRFDEDIVEGVTEAQRTVQEKTVNLSTVDMKTAPKTKEEAIESIPKGGKLFQNDDQGVDIKVTRKALRHGFRRGEDYEFQAAGAIDQIIKNAVKIGEPPVDEDEIGTTDSVSIYYAPVDVDGKIYSVRLTIKRYIDKKGVVLDDLAMYDMNLHNEKTDSRLTNVGTSEDERVSASESASRYKVKDLIYNSQKEDKELIGINNRQTRFDEDQPATVEDAISRYTEKYKTVPGIVIHLNEISDRDLCYIMLSPMGVDINDYSEREISESAEDLRNAFAKTEGFYNRLTKNIAIFAENISKKWGVERVLFHENIHYILNELYGEDTRSVADVYWDVTPEEVNGRTKEFIRNEYRDKDELTQREEWFTYSLMDAMLTGNFEPIDQFLSSDPVALETVNNILNKLGYDKEKEKSERTGRRVQETNHTRASERGRNAKDNKGQQGGGNAVREQGLSVHQERIAKHIDALAEKLGTRARTTVYHSLSEVPEGLRQYIEEAHKRGRRVRGWYENGQIYLFLPDINSTYEAEKTIWHETVAHHGLRQLVGDENLDKLLRQLWLTHKDGAMGKWVTERMTRNGWALNEAIEEYLAREAEKNPFKEPTLWQRVRWMLADILHSMGFASDPTISDVQYLFWLSQNRLNDNDPLGSIKRQAFLYRLERAARESAGNGQYVNLNAERVEDIERRFDESTPVFVSNALDVVSDIKQEKATPEQWLKMIEKNGGLKAGEDKWIGLSDWLKGQDKKSITKQEILDFIRKNQIQIEEVNYSENSPGYEGMSDWWKQHIADEVALGAKYGMSEDKTIKMMSKRLNNPSIYDAYKKGYYYIDENGKVTENIPEKRSEPVRIEYTTDGLKNKKEIALTVPTIESWNEGDEIHFGDAGEGRAVAWVRFGETTDADGKKVLVIDEIQSKRHQEGREKGYKPKQEIDAAKKQKEAWDALTEYEAELNRKHGNYLNATEEEKNELSRLREEWQKLFNEAQPLRTKASIPDAPFEKNWHELAMKRMLRYAAENGYDKVAWTKGEQQAERYSLGGKVDSIYIDHAKNDPGKYSVTVYDGESMPMNVLPHHATAEEITNVFGKELAKKLIDGVADNDRKKKTGEANRWSSFVLEGNGLSVGGEGMKGFYDQMLPRFMDKYGKKWGVKTGEVVLPNVEEAGRKMWSVDVTPAMKESVMRGQRMFDMDIEEPAAHSARAVYEDRLNRAETVFSEAYQDSMISLKAGQNAIAKDKDIPDSQNAYMAENLMHGKNKNEQDLFNLMFRDPLINTINKIMDLTGMNWGDVDRYVYTKSGLERNREFFVRDWLEQNKDTEGIDEIRDKWLALKEKAADIDESYTFADYLDELTDFIKKNINAKYDPSKHDYSGFRAMFGENYDESEIIDDLMNTETEIGDDVNTLWEQINACTKYGLDRYKEAGLKSEEQIENVKKMFHWYVPMRGFKEDTGEDMYQYFTGKGRTKNYVGGLLKHAKGRGSEASYPISTIFAMTYKAIADCNQNLVNQKFYRLCQANKNDLVVLSDSWVKLNENTGEWEEVWPQITDDMSEEEIRQATIDFEKEMNGLADVDKAKKIKGKPNFAYKPIDKNKKNEHVVEVWMNGQKKLATVVGNPRMAQALNGQLRFEKGHNIFSKWNADIKNFMSSLFTSYSPTFALRNMLRDWTHFAMMLNTREGAGYAKAALNYYRETLPRPYHGKKRNGADQGARKIGMMELFKKYRAGTLDMNKEVERDFKDFMDNGGITGFVQMNKIDDIQKEMEKLHKQMKDGKVIKLNNKLWDITLGAVEAVNEAIENNARFATYRASRHYANRTKARSAYDAKEITVNFNRKGAGSKTAGFKGSSRVEHAAQLAGITSQILGEGRIFFNATIQAIATTFKNFQNPDGSLNKPYIAKWAAKYAAPPFLFGLALPFINQMLAAALGGDDDDDPYADLPEWTRRKNLCIYAGKWDGHDYFITIPVGQELAAFLSLGDMFAGYTYAPNLKPVDRSFTDDMTGIMNTFSPIDVDTKITKGGITRNTMSEITGRTFSVLAPLVAVEQNLSWTGREIYREDVFENDYRKPEYQMVYSGTNPVLVGASKILHELGGGDDITRGKMEVNPAIVQYLWEQYTGGPGKVFSNTISIGKDVKDIFQGKDSEFNVRKVEGLKAFVQQGDDRTEYYRVKAKYRKYKEDADKLYNDIKGYKSLASEDPTAKMKLDRLMKGEEYARMKIAREAEKHLAKMRKSADALEGAEKKKRMKEYNKLLKEVVDRLDDVQ